MLEVPRLRSLVSGVILLLAIDRVHLRQYISYGTAGVTLDPWLEFSIDGIYFFESQHICQDDTSVSVDSLDDLVAVGSKWDTLNGRC